MCQTAMALVMVTLLWGCTGMQDRSRSTLLEQRLQQIESRQEESRTMSEQLRQDNALLAERVDTLSLEVVDLSMELQRLQAATAHGRSLGPEPSAKPASLPVPKEAPDIKKRAEKSAPITPADKVAADETYQKGLGLVRGGKPVQGRHILVGFIRKYPHHALVPNAHYWIGESYVDQKIYSDAILAFKQVPEHFPQHPKAPDALLKIASCYQFLGDKPNASFYLGILVKKYPDAPATKLARERFADLL
ncbi:tol-pal system protein YbgF [Desulfoplanes formicivorans]|uniref:Tol-pal system protein YbgF n=1 Tax=Desulfoplanes formicivorans TaxID=1592317 RepID=A0A194AI29_9BACT|nr:tol-pal system protein YbgF [Desulfoplanes formicivorans]